MLARHHAVDQAGGLRGLVVIVQGDHGRRNALARKQAACHPAVLAQHGVGVPQGCQGTGREVAEVADRRRYKHKARPRRRTTGRIR
ncbi:hypothetical protein Rmf_49480 [Roseomonas fluvialis]|uniref:Uncharacterized protein n=1 Tax=Roseomonas fluvialis TaxID=1750527 RepID=A0ABN6PBL2_9PROT|nr:hypothetical protein Rmf_49480 [Roseomonas fluvialis]